MWWREVCKTEAVHVWGLNYKAFVLMTPAFMMGFWVLRELLKFNELHV